MMFFHKPLVRTMIRYLSGFGVILSSVVSSSCLADGLATPAKDTKYLSSQSLDLYKTIKVNGGITYQLPQGLFIVTETISLPSDSTLQGAGTGTVLKAAEHFKGSRFITNADIQKGNGNITLRSFALKFDLKELPGGVPGIMRFERVSNLAISDISMETDTRYYAIDLSAAINNAKIEGCIILNKGSGGCIQVRNRVAMSGHASKNIRITGNKVTSFSDEPLAVFGWTGQVESVVLEDNTVEAKGASFGISVYGIDSPSHTGTIKDVEVRKNRIVGGRIGSIGIKGGARNIVVLDNTIANAQGDGIFMHTGGSGLPKVSLVSVCGNEITNIGRHGIFATGNEISIKGNRIINAKGSGVYLQGTVSVIENSIESAQSGILSTGTQKMIIKDNKMLNAPVRILDNKYVELKGNTIE